jgi:hypothetical protein
MSTIQLIQQIEALPEELRKEVNDFVEFLVTKSKKEKKLNKTIRQAGLAKGMIEMKPDFDKPLEDFKDYM